MPSPAGKSAVGRRADVRGSAAPGTDGHSRTLGRAAHRPREAHRPVVYEIPIALARGTHAGRLRSRPHSSAPDRRRTAAATTGCRADLRAYMLPRRKTDPDFTWEKLCSESVRSPESRRAMRAYHAKKSIENRAEEKLRVIEDLFRLHAGEPCLIFAGSNAMARDVSLRFLIPCLLSHCGKKERLDVLQGLRGPRLSGARRQPGPRRRRRLAGGQGGDRHRRQSIDAAGEAAARTDPAKIGQHPGDSLRNRLHRYERRKAFRRRRGNDAYDRVRHRRDAGKGGWDGSEKKPGEPGA